MERRGFMPKPMIKNKIAMKNYRWLILSLLVLVLDQWTKLLVSSHLLPYEPLAMLSYFNLTLVFNTGAAFSLLHMAGGWQRWFFIAIAALVSLFIVAWLRKLPSTRYLALISLTLVLGGALANLWDRLVLGYVIDFLDFHLGEWHWPVFNVADVAIDLGVLLLLIDSWRQHEDKQ
jgi:signal peptidase II